MSPRPNSWIVAGAAAVLVPLAATGAAATPTDTGTGPSTETAPYVLPLAAGVDITSLLTVADGGSASNGYEMVGIPDGLGAFARNNGKVATFMNHELPATSGIVRKHGQTGAFVSRLVLKPNSNEIVRGADLIDPGVQYWDYLQGSYEDMPNLAGVQADGDVFPAYLAAFGRFCSGDLTAPGQLYNPTSGRGYDGQVYFANEEVGDEGRAFGVTTRGKAYQLPRLGLFSWENTLAAYNQTDTTMVMGNEDASTGQMWVYSGTKTFFGQPMARAGLTNGADFVIDLLDEAVDSDAAYRAAYGKGSPQPFDLSEVDWDQSGADQNAEALVEGLTLNRIEDGEFDPNNPNDYYFLTTAGSPQGTRDGGGLWLASFTDIEQPELGGTLTLLLDGTESINLASPDNMTIDQHGNLLIQEDPGGSDILARIVAYRIADGATGAVAEFDPALFAPGGSGFLTNNEESSGIVDTEDLLGPGSFLFDAQVHVAPPENPLEYVERGQFLRLQVSDWSAIYGS